MLLGQKSFVKSLEMGTKGSSKCMCLRRGNPPTAILAVENVGWKSINCGEVKPKSFSQPAFFHKGSLIWYIATWGTLSGIHLSSEGQNKLHSLKRALRKDRSADVLPSEKGDFSGLKSHISASWLVSPATQKNQWDEPNPAPAQITHTSLPLGVRTHTCGEHKSWLGMPW